MKELILAIVAFFSGGQKLTPTQAPQALPTLGVTQMSERSLPAKYQIYLPKQEFQTFNNCGPTTLSMMLNFYGVKSDGKTLGKLMRPYQHPKGDNDDKTVFAQEFLDWSHKYGLSGYLQVGGDIQELRRLVAMGRPVVVKTLLHRDDDIAHFRIITGYDEGRQVIVQDDSFDGKRKPIRYDEFLKLWQPFGYVMIVLHPNGVQMDVPVETQMWEQLADRSANGELYDDFNLVVANYHLGKYSEAVELFEKIENKLPRRTLWYQIEPIEAYLELGNYAKVFELTDKILNDGNRAFSELYLLRGKAYEKMGDKDKARTEYRLAHVYNNVAYEETGNSTDN
jgi:uncharacterized protein YvpB